MSQPAGGEMRPDQDLVREGLPVLLEDEPDLTVAGGACDGSQALTQARLLDPRRDLDGPPHAPISRRMSYERRIGQVLLRFRRRSQARDAVQPGGPRVGLCIKNVVHT